MPRILALGGRRCHGCIPRILLLHLLGIPLGRLPLRLLPLGRFPLGFLHLRCLPLRRLPLLGRGTPLLLHLHLVSAPLLYGGGRGEGDCG